MSVGPADLTPAKEATYNFEFSRATFMSTLVEGPVYLVLLQVADAAGNVLTVSNIESTTFRGTFSKDPLQYLRSL